MPDVTLSGPGGERVLTHYNVMAVTKAVIEICGPRGKARIFALRSPLEATSGAPDSSRTTHPRRPPPHRTARIHWHTALVSLTLPHTGVAQRIERCAMTELARQSIAADTIERKILQRRLSAYGRIVAAFLASYLVVFNYINVLNPAYSWRSLIWNGSNLLHAAAAVVMILVWLSCRTADRPMNVLRALDSAGFLMVGAAFTASVWVSDPGGSRNYAMQLELANLMVARSVLVPSSGQRTIESRKMRSSA
jgi:hypothetical protein